MKFMAYFRSVALKVLHRSQVENDMDEELRSHIQNRADDLECSGLSCAEAERRARMEFGGYQKYKEEIRESLGAHFIETLLQDIRHAFRMLRKSPSFTLVAVLTLALGIGANTAIFSLVDCLLVRPLPIDHPEQVAFLISSWNGSRSNAGFSYPNFQEIRKQTANIFSDLSAFRLFQMDGLTVDGKSGSMWAGYVNGNFFGQSGIKPALGRLILPSEGSAAGTDPVLVLGYSYWKSRFNGDRNIIGQKASINGHPITIVGVAPAGFHGLTSLMDTQGYMPLGMAVTLNDASPDLFTTRENTNLALIARLRPGASLREAQPALNVVAQRLSEEFHGRMTLSALHLGPAGLAINPTNPGVLSLVSGLFLILAVSVLVLACMNIANLFLVRAATRQREMAMRAALGATRSRLIRQLLTESLLLAAFGCAAGIILGVMASNTVSSIPLRTSLPLILDFHFDWRVFAYALAAAVLTGVLVGILPALRAARGDANEILHEGGRTSTGGRQHLRSALVMAQVGGSLMLLIVAGLFVRSLEKVQHTNLGFDPNHVLNLSINPHESGYDETQGREFQETLLDRVRVLPGIESASLAASVPMGYNDFGASLEIDGYQPPKGQRKPVAGYNAVSSGYFETMRIPLLRGHDIRNSDDKNSQHVAIINQAMADRYWHGQDPMGRHFSATYDPSHPMQVIGIVKNSYEDDIFEQDPPFFFVPLAQYYNSYTTLQIRAATSPEAMAREVTGLIHSLEPAMPVFDVQPMTTALETVNGFLLYQLAAAVAASLGILGLILAVVGVYGVISYAAAQRTHEIGIRLALGAEPRQILKLVFRQGFVIVGTGVLAGILSAVAMARLVGNLLFGVPPGDLLTYVSATALLAVVALLACYIPARRAMSVDPMVALRHE
jgi:predicted permease